MNNVPKASLWETMNNVPKASLREKLIYLLDEIVQTRHCLVSTIQTARLQNCRTAELYSYLSASTGFIRATLSD